MSDFRFYSYRLQRKLRRLAKFIVPLAIVFILVVPALLRGLGCKRETGVPGHESYVVRRPWGGKTTFVQTLRGVESTPLNLFYDVAETLDMRPQRYIEEFNVTVKGDVNIKFRAHILIVLKPGGSRQVIEKYGAQFYQTRVKEPFRQRVRAEVTKHGVFEVKDQRQQIAANVLTQMREEFADEPFDILDVLAGNIDYDPKVKLSAVRAIVKKEESNQRDILLKIQQQDNQIEETEAEGIRQSQDIIRGSLTRRYNTWNGLKAIEELAGAGEEAVGEARPAPNTTFIFAPFAGGSQVSFILPESILQRVPRPRADSPRRAPR